MARQYPDLRYKYVRGLIRHERDQRRQHFLKQAAEWTSKAIVSLSLTTTPIRSLKQAQKLEGIGGVTSRTLKEVEGNDSINEDAPSDGKYVSSAAALLVAMLNAYENLHRNTGKNKILVPEQMLREYASPICEEYFIDNVHRDEPVFCMSWWRLTVLISRGYIKKRSQNRQPVYELLDEGFQLAHQLRGTTCELPLRNPEPITGSSSLSSIDGPLVEISGQHGPSTKTTEKTSDALYSYDDGSDGVMLLVDMHEQGGDRCHLGELSQYLSEIGIRHKTRHLKYGDYCWVWRCQGQERILPILVERKRADDLAWSLKDGRYFRQKQQMIEWKDKYPTKDITVTLTYLIERDPAEYKVRCGDGCGGVAKCGNPSVKQVNNVITELENSADFDVIRTPNLEGSIDYLTSVTLELQQRLDSGDFDSLIFSNNIPTSGDICEETPVVSCQICCSDKSRKQTAPSSGHKGKKTNIRNRSKKVKNLTNLDDDDEGPIDCFQEYRKIIGVDSDSDESVVKTNKRKSQKKKAAKTTEIVGSDKQEKGTGCRIVPIGGNIPVEESQDWEIPDTKTVSKSCCDNLSTSSGKRIPKKRIEDTTSEATYGSHHRQRIVPLGRVTFEDDHESEDQEMSGICRTGGIVISSQKSHSHHIQISSLGGVFGKGANKGPLSPNRSKNRTSNTLQSNLRDIQVPSVDDAESHDCHSESSSGNYVGSPSISTIGGVFTSKNVTAKTHETSTPQLSTLGGSFNSQTRSMGNQQESTTPSPDEGYESVRSRKLTGSSCSSNYSSSDLSEPNVAKRRISPLISPMDCRYEPYQAKSTCSLNTHIPDIQRNSLSARKTGLESGQFGETSTDNRASTSKAFQEKKDETHRTPRKRHSYVPLPTFDSDSDNDTISSLSVKTSGAKKKKLVTPRKSKQASQVSTFTTANLKQTFTESVDLTDHKYSNNSFSDDEFIDPFSPTTYRKRPEKELIHLRTAAAGDSQSHGAKSYGILSPVQSEHFDDDSDEGNQTEDKIMMVLSVLPYLNRHDVKETLRYTHWNVEAALDRLLDDGPANNQANAGPTDNQANTGPTDNHANTGPTDNQANSHPDFDDDQYYMTGLDTIDLTDSQ